MDSSLVTWATLKNQCFLKDKLSEAAVLWASLCQTLSDLIPLGSHGGITISLQWGMRLTPVTGHKYHVSGISNIV